MLSLHKIFFLTMAIEENKVTLVGVNSASVTFSNEANVEKQYKVNANVNVSNGKKH